MEKDLIKIRCVCYFNSAPGFGIIAYKDIVPGETTAYKGTRKHKDTDIVEIGVPWTQTTLTPNEDGPMWSAYVILEGNTPKSECLKKAGELFGIAKQAMLDDTAAFLERAGASEFDWEKCANLYDEYFKPTE